jgi:hypothetical protein
MTMQMLQLSGLFLGKVIGKTRANPQGQGQLENHEIISNIIKPELKAHGYDPKGQRPLPPLDWYNIDPNLRDSVLKIIKRQGLKDGQKYGLKALKCVFNWQSWNNAFPDAHWIIVRRNDRDIIKSCMSPKAAFMDKYTTEQGWQSWIDHHKKKFEQVKQGCNNVYELDTDAVINKDLTQLKAIIDAIGLDWKPDKILKQICP